MVRRVDERASVKELLQSPFLQRAAAEGVLPCTVGVGTEATAVATDGRVSGRAPKEDADLPKLTSLVQSLQDDELTVAVLKLVSSIVAEATYGPPPFNSPFFDNISFAVCCTEFPKKILVGR